MSGAHNDIQRLLALVVLTVFHTAAAYAAAVWVARRRRRSGRPDIMRGLCVLVLIAAAAGVETWQLL